MRDLVGQADLGVDGADGIGERTASGHDEHRAAPGQRDSVRAGAAQAVEPLGPQQPAADLDDQRAAAHSRPSTDSATAAATSPPCPGEREAGTSSGWTARPQRVAASRARNAPTPTATTGTPGRQASRDPAQAPP